MATSYSSAALAAVAALACASPVHAESWFAFEAGIGITSATKVGDGIYYSKGFSHDTPDGSYGGRVGILLNALSPQPRSFTPGLRIHLGYQNFGKVRWSSSNPQDEGDFTAAGQKGGYDPKTGSCIDDNCGVFRTFNSTGGIQSVALTLEPYWDVGSGWTVGIEAGPALYRSTWTSVAVATAPGKFGPAGTAETLSHVPSVRLGALAGVSVCDGAFCGRVNYLYAPATYGLTAKDVPAGIKGEWMLSINYTF
ncbi:hypothetical protein [Paraburkholderia sp.]|uniref:hypothetical protein n=1 Tax=Paraburkholderia sp. TaxID=1926495 RepID=UPI003C7D3485